MKLLPEIWKLIFDCYGYRQGSCGIIRYRQVHRLWKDWIDEMKSPYNDLTIKQFLDHRRSIENSLQTMRTECIITVEELWIERIVSIDVKKYRDCMLLYNYLFFTNWNIECPYQIGYFLHDCCNYPSGDHPW